LDVINDHEMFETQVMLHLQGNLTDPSCLVSARAGRARLRSRGREIHHEAFSQAFPPQMLETAMHMRDDALAKLSRFADLPATLTMQGMIRERSVPHVARYRQAFAGFWGSLKIEGHWDSIFGTNPDGEPVFRRGPWEAWPVDLPEFGEVNPRYPIILSPYCATLFHESVGHALEDDYLQGSPLKFYRGEKVSNTKLTIQDRPDLPGYAGSMTHDDVGWPLTDTTLIHQGFLVGDLSSKRGAHRRDSYRDAPLVRATNFMIRGGDENPATWLSSLERCYYVSWIQSGNWRPGGERFKVLTGPIFEVHRGKVVAKRSWVSLRFSIGGFLGSIAAVGRDMTMDPVVHWCVKKNQRVPMSMGSPSLLLEDWS